MRSKWDLFVEAVCCRKVKLYYSTVRGTYAEGVDRKVRKVVRTGELTSPIGRLTCGQQNAGKSDWTLHWAG